MVKLRSNHGKLFSLNIPEAFVVLVPFSRIDTLEVTMMLAYATSVLVTASPKTDFLMNDMTLVIH